MRIQHKVNHGWTPNRNDPEWERRVEREAMITTAATERAFAKAQERLRRAEDRLAAAASKSRVAARRLAVLEEIVELRRQELIVLQSLMTNHGSPSTSRGKKSHRGVPGTRAL